MHPVRVFIVIFVLCFWTFQCAANNGNDTNSNINNKHFTNEDSARRNTNVTDNKHFTNEDSARRTGKKIYFSENSVDTTVGNNDKDISELIENYAELTTVKNYLTDKLDDNSTISLNLKKNYYSSTEKLILKAVNNFKETSHFKPTESVENSLFSRENNNLEKSSNQGKQTIKFSNYNTQLTENSIRLSAETITEKNLNVDNNFEETVESTLQPFSSFKQYSTEQIQKLKHEEYLFIEQTTNISKHKPLEIEENTETDLNIKKTFEETVESTEKPRNSIEKDLHPTLKQNSNFGNDENIVFNEEVNNSSNKKYLLSEEMEESSDDESSLKLNRTVNENGETNLPPKKDKDLKNLITQHEETTFFPHKISEGIEKSQEKTEETFFPFTTENNYDSSMTSIENTLETTTSKIILTSEIPGTSSAKHGKEKNHEISSPNFYEEITEPLMEKTLVTVTEKSATNAEFIFPSKINKIQDSSTTLSNELTTGNQFKKYEETTDEKYLEINTATEEITTEKTENANVMDFVSEENLQLITSPNFSENYEEVEGSSEVTQTDNIDIYRCDLCTKLNVPIRKTIFNESSKMLTLEIQFYKEPECKVQNYNFFVNNASIDILSTKTSIDIPFWNKCRSYNFSFEALDFCNNIFKSSIITPARNDCQVVKYLKEENSSGFADWIYFTICFGFLAIILILIIIAIILKRTTVKTLPESAELEVLIPHIVSVKEFPQHYAKYKEKNSVFKNEFSSLSKVGENLEITVALLPQNKKKNRYVNILPYDCTRVKLPNIPNELDYINASYIKGYSQQVEYIATQGPLESTLADFWRMVVHEKVHIIVMVAQFQEQNRNKCFPYIPSNKELMFIDDDLQIKCSYELNYDYYIERQIVIQNNKEQLTIVHLQYLNWPDFGCPNGTENMLSFVLTFRQYMESNYGKALVHCSAGVGRTGTLIAVDILLQTIRDDGDLDIYTVVANLRAQRHKMVQAEEQYLYIYRCVNDYILNPPKLKEIKVADAIYENVPNIIELQDFNCGNGKSDTNENIDIVIS